MHNSMEFSTFIVHLQCCKCNHHHYLAPEHFHPPKGNSMSISSYSPFLPFATTNLLSLFGFASSQYFTRAFLMTQMVKNLPTMQGPGFNPSVGKIPWKREWLLTPVFFPGEFYGQRSLEGYSSYS